MTAEKVKIGVLGMANIALRSVIPSLLVLDDCFELVAVATRRRGEHSNSALPDIDIIEGYGTLLDKRKIDAVYVPLPNALHFEWVKKALNEGLHVLVEKSLACTYEEVVALNEIAERKNLALVENFQFRFHAQLAYIQTILKGRLLGDLRIVRSTFCFPPFPDKNNIRYQKVLGGGALLDAGAYPVKIAQIILGNDLYVTAASLNKRDDFDVDIWGGASLQQKEGSLFAQIAFGFDHFYQCNLELVGTQGRLFTNRIFTAKDQFNPKIIIETNNEGTKEITLAPDDHFRNMLLHFFDLITGEKNKSKEYKDNISQAGLLQEIRNKSNEK